MLSTNRSSTVTLGSIARQAIAALVTTLVLCTPALAENARVGMEGALVTFRDGANREQVIDALVRQAVAQTAAAQTAPGRAASRRRLGRWATIPGTIFGAMIGGAVDCLVTRCAAQVPNGVWTGMFAGMAITAFAPRRVAGTYLGIGGGIVAGSLIGAAIEGGCSGDHPCTKGVLIGDTVGAPVGALLGYRLSGQ